jgi:hypothetical protein
MSKKTADIIIRALLAIVAAIRSEYDLPDYKNITISFSGNFEEIEKRAIIPKEE